MADRLHLALVTPTGGRFETSADEVVIPAHNGQLGILPGHTPYLALVVMGSLSYTSRGQRRYVAVKEGLAEISDDVVTLLIESFSQPQDSSPQELMAKEKDLAARIDEAMDHGQDIDSLLDEMSFLQALKTSPEGGESLAR